MSGLSLSILGPYDATLDGRPLGGFRTRLAKALLIYLACEPQRHRREHLMTMLWPDLPQSSAQLNLRQNLHLLRRTIPEVMTADGQGTGPFVLTDNDSAQLNPAAVVVVDARRFAGLIERIRPGLSELEEATALYRGDFLADFYLPDSNPFEEWAAARREAYRRGALQALERLAATHLNNEEFIAAENYARRQLTVDPLHESGHRQLIEILARDGRRSAALAHFDDYRRLLQVELGVKPGTETMALVSAVQAGELLAAARRPEHIRGYEIHEELGRGMFGHVFRASQPAIGRDVAIKVIPARYADDLAFIHRFEVEAQTIARLEHPQIVPLYDYWREPGAAYLVMRYLRGGNLRAALDVAPWPLDKTTKLLDQLAAALAAAHRHGVVHCDVKPGNILLDEEGNAYLSDFGIARLLQPDGSTTAAHEIFAGTPEYVSPEQALNEVVTPLSDQYSLGLVVYELLAGAPPFTDESLPALLEKQVHEPLPSLVERQPQLPAALDDVLSRATAKRPEERFPDIVAFSEAFHAVARGEAALQVAPLLDVANPYKGLLAFNECDADLFYGREALTKQLLDRLADTGPQNRFLAVVGPSGSGKSSLVRAGLLPALRQGAQPMSEQWFFLDMIPGTHPYEELETALLRIAVNPPATLLDQLQDGERGLLRAVRRTLPPDGGELLLLIDQFEELFTLVEDADVATRFMQSLVAAVSEPRSPLRVVVTLRADFYDRPLLYPGLSELFRARTEVIIPLSTDELVRAIEQPARRVGVEVQPELVAALVADVGDQPGALPLLQYTLSELFEDRQDGRLTLDAYRRLGGIRGALAQRAEAVYKALDDAGQSAARALFSRLITLGEGVEDTRRRASRVELDALEVADESTSSSRRPAGVAAALDAFGRARLLAFDHDPVTRGPTVEIAHEALLRAWPRLRGWVDEDRATLRLSRLLTAAAAEWEAAGRAAGFVLRGARLDQLAPLAGKTLALTDGERLFLDTSLKARKARQAIEEERRQAEIASAQKLADTERRRADEETRSAERLRQRAALLAGAMGLALVLAIAAFSFARSSARNASVAATREAEALANAELAATREAEASRNEALAATREAEAEQISLLATSRELASASLGALGDDPELSILLALRALEMADTQQAGDVLHTAIQASRVKSSLNTDATGYFGAIMTVTPDGRLLATAGQSAATIWDLATGEALQEFPLMEHMESHHQLSFDAEGENLILVSAPRSRDLVFLQSWNMANEQSELITLPIAHDESSDIVTNSDQTLLAAGRENQTAELWDITTGRQIATLDGHNELIIDVIFNRSGHLLATADYDGQVFIWDVAAITPDETPEPIAGIRTTTPPNVTGTLVHAVFVDETTLVLGYLAEVEVWNVADLDNPLVTRLSSAELTRGYALSPSGAELATVGQDGFSRIWSLAFGEQTLALAQHPSPVDDVAFSPDGRHLITLDRDGLARVWDTRPLPLGERQSILVDPGAFDVEISPDGQFLALGSVGGPASLWDIATGERRQVFAGEFGGIYRVAFHPEGHHLAGVGQDNRLHVWSVVSGASVMSIPAHEHGIAGGLFQGTLDVAYSPDGSRLVTAGADGLAKVWNAETGELLLTLAGHTDSLHSVAYSPDGRLIATTSDDGDTTVKVWDALSGAEVHTLTDHVIRVWGLAFSPDSQFLITGGARGIIKLWDMATGEEIYTLIDEPDHIGSVAFTPDGQHFITTGEVPLRVRRVSDGAEVRRVSDPILWSAKVSHDGRWIYAGDVNGMVRVLAVNLDDAVAMAEEKLTRWWRPEECLRYLHTNECPPMPEWIR